jgi:Golgi phosphoprotein 3 (GPP34)
VPALQKKVKHQRRRLEARLVGRGVLGEEEHRVLGVFPTPRYPVGATGLLHDLQHHVRLAVLGEAEVTPASAVLISLASACGVLDRLFTREERRESRRRAKEIARGEALGKAVRDTVAAANAAVTSAVIASTVAASAASTSSGSSC